MRQLIIAAIVSTGVLGFVATAPVKAQALRPYSSPAVSPYLNLLRAGQNPAVNYYGLVRPQMQYTNAINSLEQQVQANRVAATAAESQGVLTTGHPIYFMNYKSYFLNTGVSSPFQNVGARAAGGGGLPVSGGGLSQRIGTNLISNASGAGLRY